jgi:hypothetical protein
MRRKAAFCSHCGQRDTDGKLRMVDLLQRFWNNTLHLDGKFWRMVWHLLLPGKVAKSYFLGRQKRYPHPIQFFLVVMFFLLLTIGKNLGNGDSAGLISLTTGNNTVEQLQGKLDLMEVLRQNYDSLAPDLQSESARRGLDSLIVFTQKKEGIGNWSNDSISMGLLSALPGVTKPIALRDALDLTPDSLVALYEIKHPISKLMVKQSVKTAKDGRGLLRFYLGSATWTLLVITALMSWFLMLLFSGRPRLYVEHFIGLLMHFTGFLFLLCILTTLRKHLDFTFIPKTITLWWLFLGGLFWFKTYYYGSWLRVFFKYLVFIFVFAITTVIVFLLSFLVCLLIF